MKHLNLRLDDDLHARIKAAAEADMRSLNTEIVLLCTRQLDTEDGQEPLGDLFREVLGLADQVAGRIGQEEVEARLRRVLADFKAEGER
jgi:hypothetical protein